MGFSMGFYSTVMAVTVVFYVLVVFILSSCFYSCYIYCLTISYWSLVAVELDDDYLAAYLSLSSFSLFSFLSRLSFLSFSSLSSCCLSFSSWVISCLGVNFFYSSSRWLEINFPMPSESSFWVSEEMTFSKSFCFYYLVMVIYARSYLLYSTRPKRLRHKSFYWITNAICPPSSLLSFVYTHDFTSSWSPLEFMRSTINDFQSGLLVNSKSESTP